MELDLDSLLKYTVRVEASDLLLKVGSPPFIRLHGDIVPLNLPPLTPQQVKDLSYSILTPEQIEKFEKEWELDFAYEIPGVSRFRMNLLYQRGYVDLAARAIPFRIRTMEELGIPPVVKTFCERPRGIVLVTGPTGSGKSTTLAAMINYINENFSHHIFTIEDPIEFVYEDKKSLIRQREVGDDTLSFAEALRHTLRADPDIILVGEMRDLETIALAITAAETGHLVFGTLHTTDAVQTVDRVIDVFPLHQQNQIRMQLSVSLVGVISQTLVKRADGKGRVAAFEVLVGTPAVRGLIREAKTYQIASILQTGSKFGMMTLDQHLAQLVQEGVITYETALSKATHPEEFRALMEKR